LSRWLRVWLAIPRQRRRDSIISLTRPRRQKALQRRISAVRGGKRYVDSRGTGELAAEMATIAEDIRSDVLLRDPGKAAALAHKFVCLDEVIFERADDSSGVIADELRAGCVLWLDAAAAVRAMKPQNDEDWPATLHEFYQGNEYGVREPLLAQADRLLREDELRALAARFEEDARRQEYIRIGRLSNCCRSTSAAVFACRPERLRKPVKTWRALLSCCAL
jgi:hypothetical protein